MLASVSPIIFYGTIVTHKYGQKYDSDIVNQQINNKKM